MLSYLKRLCAITDRFVFVSEPEISPKPAPCEVDAVREARADVSSRLLEAAQRDQLEATAEEVERLAEQITRGARLGRKMMRRSRKGNGRDAY